MQEGSNPLYDYSRLDEFLTNGSNPQECWRVLDEAMSIVVSYSSLQEGHTDDPFPMYWLLRELRNILGNLKTQ